MATMMMIIIVTATLTTIMIITLLITIITITIARRDLFKPYGNFDSRGACPQHLWMPSL